MFRKRLMQTGAIERLFDRFDATLHDTGYLPMMFGQILDTTLVAAPKQRNIKGEKAYLHAGRIPHTWKAVTQGSTASKVHKGKTTG